MAPLVKALTIIVAIYCVALAAAYFGQRKLMYFPDRARTSPTSVGLARVTERVLATNDGERVIAWYGRARPGQPTLLYFHGNGGSLAARAERIAAYLAEGWGIYMMTYRSYGGSSGYPSEANNVADAKLAYADLVADGVPPASIILYGESLGTGIAAQLALEKPVAGLILDAPYTSIVDVAAARYWFFPVSLALSDRYETAERIARVRIPVLVLHGERDGVIPVEMGRRVYALANEPKRLVTFPNGRHSDLYGNGNGALGAVRKWIGELGPAKG